MGFPPGADAALALRQTEFESLVLHQIKEEVCIQ
jgi:hypothetical protein